MYYGIFSDCVANEFLVVGGDIEEKATRRNGVLQTIADTMDVSSLPAPNDDSSLSAQLCGVFAHFHSRTPDACLYLAMSLLRERSHNASESITSRITVTYHSAVMFIPNCYCWARGLGLYHLVNMEVTCAVLCQIMSLQYLSSRSLRRLAGHPSHCFLSYGLQVVTREVHRSSLRQLVSPSQDHFLFLTLLIIM